MIYQTVRQVKRDKKGKIISQRFGVMPETGNYTMWYPSEQEALRVCQSLNGVVSDAVYQRVRAKGEQ